jgi:hypothetical protein
VAAHSKNRGRVKERLAEQVPEPRVVLDDAGGFERLVDADDAADVDGAEAEQEHGVREMWVDHPAAGERERVEEGVLQGASQ